MTTREELIEDIREHTKMDRVALDVALDAIAAAEYELRKTGTLTLGDLRQAWEAAEVPTDDAPMRQGDVYISTVDRNDRGLGYLVAAAGTNGTHMHFNARILSRAPKREPWQDLSDVLGCFAIHDTDGKEYPDVLARMLYERGVRVVGGDEA